MSSFFFSLFFFSFFFGTLISFFQRKHLNELRGVTDILYKATLPLSALWIYHVHCTWFNKKVLTEARLSGSFLTRVYIVAYSSTPSHLRSIHQNTTHLNVPCHYDSLRSMQNDHRLTDQASSKKRTNLPLLLRVIFQSNLDWWPVQQHHHIVHVPWAGHFLTCTTSSHSCLRQCKTRSSPQSLKVHLALLT